MNDDQVDYAPEVPMPEGHPHAAPEPGNHAFRKIYREGERGRRRLEHEEINPARLILMRRFDLIIRMGFRVMVFQKVRMHQRDRAAMIVAMMGMKQRRGNQGDNHCHHTQTCAEPIHAADFLAPYGWKSTAHHFSTSAVKTAMQWTTIGRIILILCLLGFASHAFGQKVTFGAITGAQLTDDFRSLSLGFALSRNGEEDHRRDLHGSPHTICFRKRSSIEFYITEYAETGLAAAASRSGP